MLAPSQTRKLRPNVRAHAFVSDRNHGQALLVARHYDALAQRLDLVQRVGLVQRKHEQEPGAGSQVLIAQRFVFVLSNHAWKM